MSGVIHVGAWDGREYRDDDRRPLLLIEPQRRPFKQLRTLARGLDDVEVVCAAAGARDSDAMINVVEPDHSSSLLATGRSTGRQEPVHVRTLDAIVGNRNGYGTLRIDTQGYEAHVLAGALLTLDQVERVEIEVHDDAVYEGAADLASLDAILKVSGFERISWDPDGSDDLGDAVYERTA